MLSVTANDLIYGALRVAGVITGAGQTPSTEQYADGLLALNRMLDAWASRDLVVPSDSIDTVSITTGESMTVGTGGNFNISWPLKITAANLLVGTTRYPLRVFTAIEDFARHRDTAASSAVPWAIYFDGIYPLGRIYFMPTAASGNTLEIYHQTDMPTFATGATAKNLGPAYTSAIQYNLALDLHSQFPGAMPLSPVVVERAREYMTDIKRANASRIIPEIRPEFPARGWFDFNTGAMRWR